jgi:A1 cistron-splicing factor AAR2
MDWTAAFDTHSILVVINPPASFEFGIDYNIWQVGDKFRGLKLIPNGVHMICYAYVNHA